ncbi:MAG: T9SS type A sorting domain-containing protein [Chitinophagales bacterium]
MKRKILLLFVMTSFITCINAQKTQQKLPGYAITAPQKGQSGWREVRLVDITTGEELKTIYQGTDEVQPLNARTGKPVQKKEISFNRTPAKKVVNLDEELERKEPSGAVQVFTVDANKNSQPVKIQGNATPESVQKIITSNVNTVIVRTMNGYQVQSDKPFATNSAALAYDKKHDRLYYTPMSINQLRYIDLKSNKIYYFEDEPFGTVSGPGDINNQITRMVIAADGDGYALTNDGEHLIKFTTGKKPTITDLGALTDDGSNAKFSVHSHSGYGGDMIADASDNLYLITANRNVFKISIASKVATYAGTIKGLPQGFSTNGAMVEEGSKVIVCSAESTLGYFRFDLTTMQAEKASGEGTVFNASDLANGNLAFDKKKKDKNTDEVKQEPIETVSRQAPQQELLQNNGIAVYPNPVTNGLVKLSFTDQPAGKYQVQLLDMAGKLVSSQEVNVNNKTQVEEFRLPELAGKGNYLLKVFSEVNKVSVVNKIVVQ